jgi:hypothetical protein
MLIANNEQRLRAGIASLSKRCSYCTKALAAYPLIMSDDARFQVYHAGRAAALATVTRCLTEYQAAAATGHAHGYGLRSSTARPVFKSTGTEF